VGAAIVVVALLLALVGSIGEWGHIDLVPDDRGNAIAASAALGGLGHVTINVAFSTNPNANKFVEDEVRSDLHPDRPGLPAFAAGILGALAGAAYLRWRARTLWAVVVTTSGANALIAGLVRVVDVRAMFDSAAIDGHYSPGWGALTACAAALALSALGVTAVALECRRRDAGANPAAS
jgi:hypothetical protein